MSQQFDVAVIGGGVVGLTAALAMVERGFSVALIDAGPMTVDLSNPDARVYAINQASQDLLTQLGVWQHLQPERISPYQHMFVWDAANGADIKFDARMIAANHLGSIIEESVLKDALLHTLNKHKTGLTVFNKTKVTKLEWTDDSIKLSSDNHQWQAQLLMIADGANSPCRELLQVPMTSWPYHQEALVALVNTEKGHQQTAYQVFNPDGPLAFLPMVNEKLCSIVWSTTATRAKELMTLSDDDFNQELTKAFAAKLGEARVLGKRYRFPLIMRHAQRYVGTRWLLLGDAAHTIHPLAGLGLNVGLADVASWLHCLDKANRLLTSKRILSAYQRQRKYEVWQIIALMDGFKTLFTNPLTPVIALRGLGLRLCNGFSPLKRLFIEHAAGKKIETY
ncbi:2-octaprenyl-3-methyl-6-methoxy-1,4-benzoquinol hydroxylase [Legionella massiliensis]|uniref:2-octaprenyl-3-methyl-6-methoxy-1,4-benzoquinol hydroxylase n=1 Tax=Legionella massiliensis TaxID=1034943 RepID=A0A078KWM4_9GAMM|nr:FAD-dependent oxidoreductase [Legionella massiliensis]CDZ76113.1 2-octaprenyl-3-methyl-6-methoxy-1,4-benzoquinol hydroxylase [Legionella massiliensis]CEE11851.1 2-octaprenylphenol hydroxylase [Legionella massiliensis]